MTDAASPSPRDVFDRFRGRRDAAVVTERGFLALVNTHWLSAGVDDEPERVWPLPGGWRRAPEAEGGLLVTANAEDGIRVDGEPVAGTTPVNDDSTIAVGESTSVSLLHGDLGIGLRVWDAQSEALRDFGRIDVFDYDPQWVVSGAFTPAHEGETVGIGHVHDESGARASALGGTVSCEIGGEHYDLVALPSGRALQIVFADATSGASTYSVGRFLFVAPQPDGTVTLDFNLAVLPPCAFSYAFNCPMPPASNRMGVEVRAGEKNVLNTDGALLHADALG